jgi:methionyl-tRNA synthetase
VIISSFDPGALHDDCGIKMSSIEDLGVGAGWGVVPPGGRSQAQQHDEAETFVIIRGSGQLIVDNQRHPIAAGVMIQAEPFETHVIENTGQDDLLFATFYWRDAGRAAQQATRIARGRLAQRPLFVFSTPPTPNGDLHLGHLSGPYLGADVFVRFQRLCGAEAWHLTGSDDFQSYVVECARREGRTPAETAAHYSAEIAATLKLMDIPLDQYTVTNGDPAYRDGLRGYFSRIVASQAVTPRNGPALFDAATGDYLYEVDVAGGCPACGRRTGGNICEECGEPNFCHDLAQPGSRKSDLPPQAGDIVRFTLPLHEFQSAVTLHHHLGRVPARLRELADRLFERARIDVPITHPAAWGVPPAENDIPGQVIWVWPEMSFGFLHGIEELGRRLGRGWRADAPQQDWKLVHFFGYDNSFYHAILYPVLYKLAFPDWEPDIEYHLNEFLLLDGAKFSTSRRHAIWGKEILGPHSVDAVRFYLASIRSEGRRTNFERRAYAAAVRDILIGGWQAWLRDLGQRVDCQYGGIAPEAGIWTPEHTGFLARLNSRLAAVSGALGPDGFSLNQAAAELAGIVEDARRFSAQESQVSQSPAWRDEARTATALELAAAKLMATCAAPVMPRFAGKLAAALGMALADAWPQTVTLLTAGSPVTLAQQTFFTDPDSPTAEPVPDGRPAAEPLASLLAELVTGTLQLPGEYPVGDSTLLALGAASLHAVTLQYQVTDLLGVELSVDELLGERTVAELAALLSQRGASTPEVASA